MNASHTDLGQLLTRRPGAAPHRAGLLGPRLGMALLALGLLGAPACKKGKGTNDPGAGMSKEEVEKAISEAKKEAKVAGLVDLANKDLANGRHVSATKRAEEALDENPKNADAHAILGAARWRAGDFTGSTEAYEKALEIEPENFGAALGLARNLQTAGAHDEAIELADRLLAGDKKQIDPNLTKLWSYYATADADNAVKVLDEVFQVLPAEDPQLPLIQAHAAFVRPLEGKGPLCQVAGETGSSDANIDHGVGMKYTGGVVGGEFTRVILFENREEAIIDSALAKKLKLKELGKIKPLGQKEEQGIVLVPEIKFGDLSLKNVPALVQSLEPYQQAMGETPGVILGRQCLQAFGSIAYDFPNRKLTLTKEAPSGPAEGEIELPLLLVSMHVLNAPVVPIRIDGSEHPFYVYFGGVYKSGVAVTKKHYFKSGHLPREVDPPDDENAGLKMVYVDQVGLGDATLPGMGGLVLVNTPPDDNLGTLVENTAFELGGYLNLGLMESWTVRYSLPTGKVYITPAATKRATKTASAH